MRKKIAFVLMVLLVGACVVGSIIFRHRSESVSVNVDFRLTKFESDEGLAGVPVRLVVGDATGWQAKDAGYRFVTDTDGRAKFTLPGTVDRRWRWEPVGFTPFSIPVRSNHTMLAIELAQPIPKKDGTYDSAQWLHTLDLDCTEGQCATTDITWIYAKDTKGDFTQLCQYDENGSLRAPELGGMALGGPGYKAADFWLSTDDPGRKHWDVKLVVQRRPPPVLR
jgi:hypothetical protein